MIYKVRELKCGLIYKDEICWYKKSHGGRITAWGSYLQCSNPNIRRDHEYIIIWQKGKNRLENITGISSDLTKKDWNKCIYSTWEIQPETGKSKDHKNCYPEELVRRLLLLYSYPQDLIVDPFNGLGTTTTVCAKHNRRWIGIDIHPGYCRKAVGRTGGGK